MEGFFFTVKTMIFAFLLLFVLQLKIAGNTLESRSEKLIYESSASQTLNGVAQGAIRLSKDAWQAVDAMVSGTSKKKAHGSADETARERD